MGGSSHRSDSTEVRCPFVCPFPFAIGRQHHTLCQVLIPCACTGQGVGHYVDGLSCMLLQVIIPVVCCVPTTHCVAHRIPSKGSGVPTCHFYLIYNLCFAFFLCKCLHTI